MTKTEPLKILIDDPETKVNPSDDFHLLANSIARIIRDSDPHFTIGIYGEWGTGKTTLMNLIRKHLEEKVPDEQCKILTVWFNAWRYGREENFSTIALMKTIGYAMAKHEIFAKVSSTIFRGMKILGKDFLRRAALETFMTEKGVEEFEQKLTEKMEFLEKLEKDTIYFDGLETIKNQVKKIRRQKKIAITE